MNKGRGGDFSPALRKYIDVAHLDKHLILPCAPFSDMREIYLSKGRGKKRKVYSVTEAEKLRLRGRLDQLQTLFFQLEQDEHAYGFIPGRNCVQAAAVHYRAKYVLSLDVEDFFDSIKETYLQMIPKTLLEGCLINGSPPQGFSTSPMISNIFFIEVDRQIFSFLNNNFSDFTYSRYADDLTLGFEKKPDFRKVISGVDAILKNFGMRLNRRKILIQDSRNGRFIINGVGVDREGVHPTRKVLKKIRAAKDQNNLASMDGLTEWAKCKFPRRDKGNG